MARITFYTHVADIEHFVCRLAKRVADSGQTVLIWADDAEQVARLDRLLWTHDAESFVPHHIWANGQTWPDDEYIGLAWGGELPSLPADRIVINLADAVWHHSGAMPTRILEIVGAAAHQLAAARLRFTAYKQHGFTLEHHNMQDKA